MKNRNTIFTTTLLLFGCFAVSPRVHALLPPPAPDGGYPNYNTAEGDGALFNLTTGRSNTAIGFDTLYNNTTGQSNTASGINALFSNASGAQNTATGDHALVGNMSGSSNTATGTNALRGNTGGDSNTAVGAAALSKVPAQTTLRWASMPVAILPSVAITSISAPGVQRSNPVRFASRAFSARSMLRFCQGHAGPGVLAGVSSPERN